MKAAKTTIMAAATAGALMSVAFAQPTASGVVTQINRLNGTIAIEQSQEGTVGAGSGGPVREFKVKDSGMLENVHAGDRVSFTAAESNGGKTLTRLQKATAETLPPKKR